VLADMEGLHYLERGGTGKGTYWTLSPELHTRLQESSNLEHSRRINWDAAKTRVLSVLMERSRRGEFGLSNQEIRQITHFDRNQARRLMQQLMEENPKLKKMGERRWARYEYHNAQEQ
jgi:ATP-dependent DNA helicase RecG